MVSALTLALCATVFVHGFSLVAGQGLLADDVPGSLIPSFYNAKFFGQNIDSNNRWAYHSMNNWINSGNAPSVPSWSSNGGWILFSYSGFPHLYTNYLNSQWRFGSYYQTQQGGEINPFIGNGMASRVWSSSSGIWVDDVWTYGTVPTTNLLNNYWSSYGRRPSISPDLSFNEAFQMKFTHPNGAQFGAVLFKYGVGNTGNAGNTGNTGNSGTSGSESSDDTTGDDTGISITFGSDDSGCVASMMTAIFGLASATEDNQCDAVDAVWELMTGDCAAAMGITSDDPCDGAADATDDMADIIQGCGYCDSSAKMTTVVVGLFAVVATFLL